MHYFPITLFFLLLLFVLFITLIIVIEVNILEYAYEKIGINRRHVFILLLCRPRARGPGEQRN